MIPRLMLGVFLCSVDHLRPVCPPQPDGNSHVGKTVAAHHCKVSRFPAAKLKKKKKKGNKFDIYLLN